MGNMTKGTIAGAINTKGYKQIGLAGKRHLAHRIAFAFTYNRWPQPMCDHINGDPLDNRIDNLREVTRSLNMCNSRIYKTNKVGIKGVRWHKQNKRWEVQIRFNKKMQYRGYFKALEEAAKAVAQKRQELHGEFARD
jgi:hypothetical protein